ncbi:MAG TPA: glycosyltransferase [Planctomycetes bacterium]|nr:glycosyltransferase [Planctomycetota bacterium]HIL53156.1 glycosyltransferase [Planctomycetota bacterium]
MLTVDRSVKLLFVSQQAPWPLDSGGNLRTYHLLRALSLQFEVTLVATDPGGDAAQHLAGVAARVELVPALRKAGSLHRASSFLRSLSTAEPLILTHNQSGPLDAAVRAQLASCEFASLHLNHLDTARYARTARGVPVVLDTHNVLAEYAARRSEHEASAPGRWLWRREARLLCKTEPRALSACQRVLACSERERSAFLKAHRTLEVRVVPNGVDAGAITPLTDPAANPPEVVFVGDMAYGPNADAALFFADEVFDTIRAQEPEALFSAVGKNPSNELLLRGRTEAISVTGFVEDVICCLARARVFVCPIRYGSGTRLKLLEAFAAGLPVVSTRLGAEGIDCRDGEHLLLADSAGELAAAVLRLLRDDNLARRLASAGRALAEECYDWPAIGRSLVDIHRELHSQTRACT